MPANNVDLSAVLPVLAEALKPFRDAMDKVDMLPYSARPNDQTLIRNFMPLSELSIGQTRRLVEAVQAVRRMAA